MDTRSHTKGQSDSAHAELESERTCSSNQDVHKDTKKRVYLDLNIQLLLLR